jgi:tetratricopeptide (TPR) repeat protein
MQYTSKDLTGLDNVSIIRNKYTETLNALAVTYFVGEDIPVNKSKAIKLWKKCIKIEGCIDAYSNLAVTLLEEGRDYIDIVKAGAARGCIDCWFMLGTWYGENAGELSDTVKAFECYDRTELSDDPCHVKQRSDCIYYGYGCKQNLESASMCYKKLITMRRFNELENEIKADTFYKLYKLNKKTEYLYLAVELGHVNANFRLGEYLEMQESTTNPLKYYLYAYEHGNAKAAFNAGFIYLDGLYGTTRNHTEAKKCLKAAIDLGLEDSLTLKAYKYLGYIYRIGLDSNPNEKLAVKYYKRSMVLGDVEDNIVKYVETYSKRKKPESAEEQIVETVGEYLDDKAICEKMGEPDPVRARALWNHMLKLTEPLADSIKKLRN